MGCPELFVPTQAPAAPQIGKEDVPVVRFELVCGPDQGHGVLEVLAVEVSLSLVVEVHRSMIVVRHEVLSGEFEGLPGGDFGGFVFSLGEVVDGEFKLLADSVSVIGFHANLFIWGVS
jgi:hypothetical protein